LDRGVGEGIHAASGVISVWKLFLALHGEGFGVGSWWGGERDGGEMS